MAVARFKMDDDLYRQHWSDWICYVSRGRKWSIPVALLCGGSGLVLLIVLGLDSKYRIVGLFLVCLGLFNIIWHYWDKHKWFSDRRKANVTGSEVEIRFEDDRIFMNGPFSKSESEWKAFQKVLPTEKGMFLCPQHGIHVYIPDSALEPPEAKEEIINKIRCN